MAKKPYVFYSRGSMIDKATGADLGHTQTFKHTIYPDGTETVEKMGENTIADMEGCKRKLAARLSEAASEIYARRPEAFGG